MDTALAMVAHTVLEGVFQEHDEEQRGHLATRRTGQIDRQLDAIGKPKAHQGDVVGQKLHLTFHRNEVAIAVIDHIAHHP